MKITQATFRADTLDEVLYEEAIVMEALTCIKRAGADGILSY